MKFIKKNQKLITTINLLIGIFFMPFFSNAQISIPNIPEIIFRPQWNADESKMTWETKYAKVEKIIIHHTASLKLLSDSDGSGEYKKMVNNIYTYHNGKKTWYDDDGEYNGFGDIGYNYLIDPNGNIYEGRYGGNGVIGGHVNSYNIGSIGISVIGTYGGNINSEYISHPLNLKVKKSLETFIGWVAANNNINLNKTSNFLGKNIDGLVGHRDLSATTCPGNELYKQLDNIQSNATLIQKEFEKYAYQIGGNMSVYVIEDGYKTKYDSKENLLNAYKNRIIKPIQKSQLDMYKYKNIIIHPNGSLLQEFDTAKVFYIENRQKRAMEMTGEEFIKMGFSTNNIIKVFKSDLKIYENGKIIKFAPNGELLKDKNGNVFLIENGKKRKFTSPQLFEYLGYKWKNIKEDLNIDFYLQNSDMIYPDGTLVKQENNFKIYLIKNKERHEITSNNLMNVLGFQTKNVISISRDEFDHYPEGKVVKYPDNTLLKAEGFPVIYLVKDGKRKEFTSSVLFEKSGYKWNNIINTTKEEIKNYPLDGRVLYPDGLLIKSEVNPTIYLLESGKKRKIVSSTLFKKLGYNWNEVISLSPNEMNDYAIGKIMTYPDGTLIKKDGFPVVYKLENGQRKEFTSLLLFETTKSKWSDIVVLNDEEFIAYPDGGNLKYPENTLLKRKGDDKIYIIKNEEPIWIKTAEKFIKAGYKWSNIIEISKDEMNLYIKPEILINKPVISQTPKQKKDETINSSNDSEKNNPNIRIAIYSTTSEDVIISANGNYTVNYYNSDGMINKTENKSANQKTTIKFFNTESYVKFLPVSENVIMKVISYNDLAWDEITNDNEFRGNIEVKYSNTSKKLWIINELQIEDYLNGIAEALNDSPEEYLKAFGIIARTYAMYYIKRGGKHSDESFHLKNSRKGNGNDQVYKGYNFELRASKIISANRKTIGNIINYNDKPIVAAYSSDSGGTTKNACEVLSKTYCGNDYAYLWGGVKDPSNTQHDQEKISASHGTGMSAIGAYQMAINGGSWQEIINHYYVGVKIKKYY
ncbi:MAG: N-acetylmuramoyl-L-alanine amidase [Patescibacteria group bacterium]|nr:N-acetylmuramoyl-L-alanine amidase [Patescibacteria group bacterium]